MWHFRITTAFCPIPSCAVMIFCLTELSLAGTFQGAVTKGTNSFASAYSKAANRTEKALKKLISKFE